MADAAALRDERRRLVLAERLAQVEVLSEAVARGSLELVSNALPAMLEALEATIKAPARDAASVLSADDTGDRGDAGDADAAAGMDGGLLEALVRADPQRARRVLDSLTGTTGGG